MPDFPPVYLLRHGQTDWNAERRIQGQLESQLTDLGKQQAARQAEILARLGVRNDSYDFYCSPMRRTRQTADIALAGLHAVMRYDDRLKEISLGDWEGHLYADLHSDVPEFARLETTLDRCLNAPGGERFEGVRDRAKTFLQGLQRPSVIVSHGAVGAVIRGLLCGQDYSGMTQLNAEQGVVLDLAYGVETTHR